MRSLHHDRVVWETTVEIGFIETGDLMSRVGCYETQQRKDTRNERKVTRPVKTSQRDRNESSDVRVELSGQDEARQDKDASEEL